VESAALSQVEADLISPELVTAYNRIEEIQTSLYGEEEGSVKRELARARFPGFRAGWLAI
jgi:hypothetical protein